MCTVTYLPFGEGCIITSNRDESPQRNIKKWVEHESKFGKKIDFPLDDKSGGSWLAFSNSRVVCLLNGAYEPFQFSEKYSLSRGLVVKNYFDYKNFAEWSTTWSMQNVAPHTFVIFENDTLFVSVWDGNTWEKEILNPDLPYIWSSATLYSKDIREWRKKLFQKWLILYPLYKQKDIIDFHKFGSNDNSENGFVMNRGELVKTLSITSIRISKELISSLHINLEDEREDLSITKIRDLQVKNASLIK